MSAQLVVIAGPDLGRVFPLSNGAPFLVGRGATSQSRLVDLAVSRLHCEVRCDNGRVVVSDSQSGSGTFVNGQRIVSLSLQPGDIVKIGNTELRYEHQIAEQKTVPPLLKSKTAAVVVTKSEPTPQLQPMVFANKPGAPKVPQALKELQKLAGSALGSFHLKRVVGVGQIGVVFEANDGKDGKTVALKVLRPDFAQDGKAIQRFVRGMKTARALLHPNLVELYNAGITDAHCWISMEFIDGENLHQILQQIAGAGQRDWRPTLRVAIDVAKALQCIHEQGVLHRAVTPSNIMVRRGDLTAKLGDALLAKNLEGAATDEVTRTGEYVGNVYYMAPERTQRGVEVDARADLYSLGVTLYYFLTGRLPFAGKSMVEVITQIREAAPETVRKQVPSIPTSFEKVLVRLLAKRPEERYPSAAALLAELALIK